MELSLMCDVKRVWLVATSGGIHHADRNTRNMKGALRPPAVLRLAPSIRHFILAGLPLVHVNALKPAQPAKVPQYTQARQVRWLVPIKDQNSLGS